MVPFQAHTLTSSQQISIISAVYTFCMKQTEQLSTNDKESVIMNLMALTMGANFHTRLFAQIVLTKLLSSKGFEGGEYVATNHNKLNDLK